MTRKQTNQEFANLAWLMRDHIIIRIKSSRDTLDTIDLFTSVKIQSPLPQPEKNLVVWVSYTCNPLNEVRNYKQHRYQMSLIDADENSGTRSKKEVLSIIDNQEIDVSYTYIDFDDTKKTKNRLYLIHFVHLARLQGMLLAGTEYFTSYDANPQLKLAKRLGGVVDKYMQRIHNSVQHLNELV